ncbi:hypothetical protein P7K49_011942 [Saguinus oedipus]|uniref:Uncharacterized protein n=1 Tax=Saguinus oedipus TaxID=9490 RepID=A0ABQ9VSR0_SAGOE|nr:hypothetical protein P7K49_011942 [Saguinus oedipus]
MEAPVRAPCGYMEGKIILGPLSTDFRVDAIVNGCREACPVLIYTSWEAEEGKPAQDSKTTVTECRLVPEISQTENVEGHSHISGQGAVVPT